MRTCKHHTAGKVRHLARLTRHLRRNFATLGRFSFKGQGFKVSPHLLQVIFQVVAGCMTRLRNARAPAHTPSSCPRPLPAHCHWHDSELTHVGASLIGARFYFLQKVMKRARGRPALRQRRGWPRAAAGKLQWPRIPQVRSSGPTTRDRRASQLHHQWHHWHWHVDTIASACGAGRPRACLAAGRRARPRGRRRNFRWRLLIVAVFAHVSVPAPPPMRSLSSLLPSCASLHA